MTTRDLYAACVGVYVVFAVEAIVVFLAHPTLWAALLLLISLGLLLTTVVMHVRRVLKEEASIRNASKGGGDSVGEITPSRPATRPGTKLFVAQGAANAPPSAAATDLRQ
jgi:hypothetical protein